MSENNWFMSQDFKWRSVATAIWTWLLSFPVIGGFLLVWIFSPFHFITNICDYLAMLVSLRSWLLAFCMSILSSLIVIIHMKSHSVTYSLECTRFGLLSKYVHLRNLFFASCCSVINGLLCLLVGCFSTSQLSPFIDCSNSSGTFRCFNESYFVFLLFGLSLGFFNYVVCKSSHFYTLNFPTEQQGRYLSTKCNFTNLLVTCGGFSFSFLKYFLLIYYLFGVVPRSFVSEVIGYPMCDGYVISLNNMVGITSLGWTLWITGTFLLFLQALSWHLFNAYATQGHTFPVDSVFPEDELKLLTENLSEKQPLLVQHLAFQYLDSISKYSANKRSQLFMIKYEKNGKRSLKWSRVADECLSRIRQLTTSLKNFQQNMSGLKSDSPSIPSSSTSPSDVNLSPIIEKRSPDLSASTLRRRPLVDATNASILNNSCAEVSPTKAADLFAQRRAMETSALLSCSTITVPAPKWWSRQSMKNVSVSSPRVDERNKSQILENLQQSSRHKTTTSESKLVSTLKKFPLVSYFVTKRPTVVAANLFSSHNICKWAIESVSFLVAASLTEDECGFVQKRLAEVTTALLDLIVVLEKNSKLAMTPSSPSATSLLRHQHSLKADTKSAVYRIVNTFAKHMEAIETSAEHRRKLRSFLENKE